MTRSRSDRLLAILAMLLCSLWLSAPSHAAPRDDAEAAVAAAQQRVDSAQAALDRAQQDLQQAQQNNDNASRIIAEGAVGNASTLLQSAQQELQAAQAQLDALPPETGNNAPGNNAPGNNQPAAPAPSTEPETTPEETVPPSGTPEWYETCFACALFESVDNMRREFAPKAFAVVAGGLSQLMMIIVALWILVQAAQLLMPFGVTKAPREIYNTILVRLMLSFAVIAALGNYHMFWSVHEAINSAGLRIVHTISTAAIDAVDMEGIDSGCETPPMLEGGEDFDNSNNLTCTIEQMQKMLGVGIRVGKGMIDPFLEQDSTQAMFGGDEMTSLHRASFWMAGYILVLLFGLISLLIPFRVFDLLVKWTIITVFSPALVAAMLFPQTRDIAINGLKTLIKSALVLMIMGIIVGACAVLIAWTLTNGDVDTGAMTLEQLGVYAFDNPLAEPLFWQLAGIGILTNALLGGAPQMAESALAVKGGAKFPTPGASLIGVLAGGGRNITAALVGGTFNSRANKRRKANTAKRRQMIAIHQQEKARDKAFKKAGGVKQPPDRQAN